MESWLKFGAPALLLASCLALAPRPAPAQKAADAPKLTPEQTQFFESKVRPLLVKACTPCHGEGGQSKGGLSLTTAAGWKNVIVPGHPETSELIARVKSKGAPMPPTGNLSAADIATLETWVKMGAPDPRVETGGAIRLSGMNDKAKAHWLYQPIKVPAVPTGTGATNAIDAFVRSKLTANGLKPSPAASRSTLIRRVYFDLIGMPPSVEQVRAFLADKSPNAWEKVVDGLLASPHYGERWGRHWLDSARYSDTTGLLNGGVKNRFADFRYANAWTYRDWVVGALNADMPYDRFLTEQLAADKLPGAKTDPKNLAALGFLTVGKRFQDGNDQIDERIDTVTKAMLGVTVSCARCHDHPFDPIPTADYYSLHGVFASIDEPENLPVVAESTDPDQKADYQKQLDRLLGRGKEAYYGYIAQQQDIFFQNPGGWLHAACFNPRSKEAADILEKNDLPTALTSRYMLGAIRPNPNHPVLGPLAKLSRVPAGMLTRNWRMVLQRTLASRDGTPVNPIVARELQSIQPKSFEDVAMAYGRLFLKLKPKAEEVLAARRSGRPVTGVDAATYQVLEVPFPLPDPARVDSVERLRELASRFQADPRAIGRFPFNEINQLDISHPGAPGLAMAVEDIPIPRDSRILVRGDRGKPSELVPRRFLECASPGGRSNWTEGSGRLELAKAIVSPNNPLTARVLVNRVWMGHFGQGFVRTPDDLGVQSEKPSHPELLDWLAFKFMQEGWSLKKLHKRILMTDTYRQSAETNPAYEVKDPQNRLLWRASLHRLDFESIRDSMVALTGKMDPTIGGRPVNITDEPYVYRRSIYGYIDRLFLSDLLTQFDVSNPTAANSGRISTIVPQQALFFLNSPMAIDVARQVVARPEVEKAATEAEKIREVYLILFQRSPKPEEVALGQQFLAGCKTTDTSPSALPTQGNARRPVFRRPAQPMLGMAGQRGKFAPVRNNTAMVDRSPLGPLELYAQALLCSNEFVYVN